MRAGGERGGLSLGGLEAMLNGFAELWRAGPGVRSEEREALSIGPEGRARPSRMTGGDEVPRVPGIPPARPRRASRAQQLNFTRFRHEDRVWASGLSTAITC